MSKWSDEQASSECRRRRSCAHRCYSQLKRWHTCSDRYKFRCRSARRTLRDMRPLTRLPWHERGGHRPGRGPRCGQ